MKLLITLLPIQSVCMYRRHVSMCHHMCVRVSVCACTPLCVTVYACSRVFAHKEKYRGRNVAQLMGSDRTAKTTSRIKLILAGRGAKGGREHYGPGRTQRSGPASSSSQRKRWRVRQGQQVQLFHYGTRREGGGAEPTDLFCIDWKEGQPNRSVSFFGWRNAAAEGSASLLCFDLMPKRRRSSGTSVSAIPKKHAMSDLLTVTIRRHSRRSLSTSKKRHLETGTAPPNLCL